MDLGLRRVDDLAARPERRPLAHVTVVESGAHYRSREPLTFGVPLRRGALRDPEQMRAWRVDDGRGLAVQARALSRWPSGSIRWLLVDTQVEVQTRQRFGVAIGVAPDLAPSGDRWKRRDEDDGAVVLSDGYTSWRLLSSGPRGDEILGLSARLVDRFGHAYSAVFDRDSLELVERGPLRVVARLRGAHRSVDGAGLPIDFHTLTVHVHLLAGLSTARLEWTVENGPLEDPPGALAFRGYELHLDGPDEVRAVEVAPRSTDGDRPVVLTQTESRATYEVGGALVPRGPTEDLWCGVLAADRDVFVHMVESAQNHPSRLAYAPNEGLTVGLLPDVTDEEFFLDDATRKTFRLTLARNVGDAGREIMTQAAHPSHAALQPLEVLVSGAWGDGGAFYLPGPAELARAIEPPDRPPTGWAHWGEAAARNTHQTGSPRNRLSVYLEAMQSGRVDLFRWARSRAWHAMDLRPYHIQGFDADAAPWANLYEGTPHLNEPPERRLGRSGMADRFPEYKRGLPPEGHGYNGFDPEHMSLDDVYETYLLTGSRQALGALRSAGEAMLTWRELRPDGFIFSSRTFGWTLRALVQVWRATGETRYLDAARRYVARADAGRGKGVVKYLRPQRPDARHLADREWDGPWMVAVALHGLWAYWVETRDPLVPDMAADLSEFCLSGFRGNGFLADLPVDEPPRGGVVRSPLGTTSWVPGGVAAAAFITGDHGPVDRLLPYYALMHRQPGDPVRFGGSDWHWGQAYLASLQRRHGDGVVQDPTRPPTRRR